MTDGAAPAALAPVWLWLTALLMLVPVLAISLLTNQEIFNAYLVWADVTRGARRLRSSCSSSTRA